MTRSGTVECDACIMDGDSSAFGAVGALKGYFYWKFILLKHKLKINKYTLIKEGSTE